MQYNLRCLLKGSLYCPMCGIFLTQVREVSIAPLAFRYNTQYHRRKLCDVQKEALH